MPTSSQARTDLRLAVAGLGSIGARVMEALDQGIDGLVLAAVAAHIQTSTERSSPV
jgi:aspartate dehydrogenase